MSAPPSGDDPAAAGAERGPAAAGDEAADASPAGAIAALAALAVALREALACWAALAASELQVARASVPLMLLIGLALGLLGTSLWLLLVLLAGWLLLQWTQSPTLTLVILIAAHALLLLIWQLLRYLRHQLTLPLARAELSELLKLLQEKQAPKPTEARKERSDALRAPPAAGAKGGGAA